ncbi:hypothetical protein BGZ68_003320 [Mortierella alpina]|nr:hypothetical protein BGZ68_003320 [Mortierella alpina]
MHHFHIFAWVILACMATLPRSVLSSCCYSLTSQTTSSSAKDSSASPSYSVSLTASSQATTSQYVALITFPASYVLSAVPAGCVPRSTNAFACTSSDTSSLVAHFESIAISDKSAPRLESLIANGEACTLQSSCSSDGPQPVASEIQHMAQLEGSRDPSHPSVSLVPAAASEGHSVAQASSSKTYLIVGMAITMGVVAVVVSLFVLRRNSRLLGGSSVPTFEIQRKGPANDDGESGNSGFGHEKNLSAFQPETALLEKPQKAHPRNSGMNHSRNSAYIDYFQDEYDHCERRRLSYLMDAHTADLDDASVHSAEQQLLSPSPSPSPKPTSRLHQAVMSASYKLRNPRRQSRLFVNDPLQNFDKRKRGSMLIRDDSRTASIISARSDTTFVRPPKSTRRVSSRELLSATVASDNKPEEKPQQQKQLAQQPVPEEQPAPPYSYQNLIPSSDHHRSNSVRSQSSRSNSVRSSAVSESGSVANPSLHTRSTSTGSTKKTFSKPIHIKAHHHAGTPQQQSVRSSDGSGVGYQSRSPYGYM